MNPVTVSLGLEWPSELTSEQVAACRAQLACELDQAFPDIGLVSEAEDAIVGPSGPAAEVAGWLCEHLPGVIVRGCAWLDERAEYGIVRRSPARDRQALRGAPAGRSFL